MVVALEPGFEALRRSRTHRLATCWKIDRTDGTTLYLTDHDTKLTVNSNEYTPIGGLRASARQRQAGLADLNLEIDGVLNSAAVTYADLLAGRYDEAEVTEFLVHAEYPWLGPADSSRYWIRETSFDQETWHAELDGITRWTRQQAGERWTGDCPYTRRGPGHVRGRPLDLRVEDVDVDTVLDDRLHWETDDTGDELEATDDYYNGGKLTWVTGANAGTTSIVKDFVAKAGGNPAEFILVNRTPFAIAATDTFDVEPGCNKLPFSTGDCQAKFDNMNNFGGVATFGALWGGALTNLDISSTNGDGGEEGKPIPYPIGPTALVEGTVIFAESVQQRTVPASAAGQLFGSLAVGFAGREISAFLKVWADDRLIWELKTTTIASTALSVTTVNRLGTTHMIVVDTTLAAGLLQLKSFVNATTSGFVNGANNGTFQVWRVSAIRNTFGTIVRHEVELVNTAAVVEGASGSTKTIVQTSPKFQKNDFLDATARLGTSTQLSLLGQFFGATEDPPAFRHRAYILFDDFEYTKGFGDRVPRFKALVEQAASKTIASAITDVVARSSRLTASDVVVFLKDEIALAGGDPGRKGMSGQLRGINDLGLMLFQAEGPDGSLQPSTNFIPWVNIYIVKGASMLPAAAFPAPPDIQVG